MQPYSPEDYAHSPLMFYYEVTQACDLVCAHCRASAQTDAAPGELNQAAALALIEQVASFPRPPTMVMTGGDPLKRPDIYDLIQHATDKGIAVALTPSATPLADEAAFARAQAAGVRRLGVSLDGADPLTHDGFRGWCGSFARTLKILRHARELGMGVQVNTTVCERNVNQIEAMAELLDGEGIAMWALFFLIPVGRGVDQKRLSGKACEDVFARLWRESQRRSFPIKTTEAPHYRRFVMQQGGDPMAGRDTGGDHGLRRRAPLGIGDGKGIMFVSHCGEIYPAGFLPLACGCFPRDSVVEVYQRHELFTALRDPDRLKGKCGRCEFRQVCGGSRSRAYALTGDPLASEPDCVYQPESGSPRGRLSDPAHGSPAGLALPRGGG